MLTKATLEAMLLASTATGGVFAGTKVGLAKAGPTPSINDELSDYTECNYTGYAKVAISAWTAPSVDTAGEAETLGGLKTFQPSDAVTPNMVTHVIITDTAGAVLVAAKKLDDAISLGSADAAIHGVPQVVAGPEGLSFDFLMV